MVENEQQYISAPIQKLNTSTSTFRAHSWEGRE